jgi:hypothetical protein
MITALLLLPVLAILTWLYWFLLPDRSWRIFDSMVLVFVILLSGVHIGLTARADFTGAGPIWPQVVSVLGAYGLITTGLLSGLLWRRLRSADRGGD